MAIICVKPIMFILRINAIITIVSFITFIMCIIAIKVIIPIICVLHDGWSLGFRIDTIWQENHSLYNPQ